MLAILNYYWLPQETTHLVGDDLKFEEYFEELYPLWVEEQMSISWVPLVVPSNHSSTQ